MSYTLEFLRYLVEYWSSAVQRAKNKQVRATADLDFAVSQLERCLENFNKALDSKERADVSKK